MPIKALAKVLVNGYNLSGESTALTVTTAVETVEWQTIDQAYGNSLPDVPMSNIAHSGYWSNADPAGLEKQLYTALATANATVVTVLLGTQLAAPVAYSLESAFSDSVEIAAPAGNIITVDGNWLTQAGERMLRGMVVHDGNITAAGAQTGIDFGAAGSAGGTAHLHVTAVIGTAASATIQIQGSTAAGFSSPVTLGTFTFSGNSTTGIKALVQSLGSGTVHRYVRANVTSMGGATSFNVTIVAGQRGQTY